MKYLIKLAFILGCVIATLACSQLKDPTGKATLTGNFSGSFPVGQIYTLKISVPNLVIGDIQQFDEYETQLELDGSFSLSIPLFNSVYALLSVNEEDCDAVFLSPDKETKVELSLNEMGEMQINLIEGQKLTMEDLDLINRSSQDFFKELFDPENSLKGLRFDMSPEEYKDYLLKWTEEQLSIVEKNESLPVNLKNLLYKQIKWSTYIGILFDYEGQVRSIYEYQQAGKEANEPVFTPIKPDKTYYSFLRFFDLNNPPELGSPSYSIIYEHILDNVVLNIPLINNQPVTDWLKEVKTIMTDLVGSNTDLFYDFLTFHAYLKQLNNIKPLSDQQKENIKTYFKNPTFTKFLFKENEETIKQSKWSSTIKETPSVPKEELMNAIISRYKGKVVVVDFWATWCTPCLVAIKEIKPLKEELDGKNIVFIYITETSSPAELWKKKILGIDGEHYYLSEKESEYLYNHFQINAIPTYQLYDSTGILKHQVTGFPGTEEMQKMIEELLL
jgi:thiol-disulfide isomerase/thioredoxin